ncbi:MAG: hypothetical protein SRB2_03674 [Desulfobacteraceae bacterium Eth-SRB2]|nr:MAG: hypothetical protein SRB2_03674 [Desulfobacteraceae bacterium Eth-SRB2]
MLNDQKKLPNIHRNGCPYKFSGKGLIELIRGLQIYAKLKIEGGKL